MPNSDSLGAPSILDSPLIVLLLSLLTSSPAVLIAAGCSGSKEPITIISTTFFGCSERECTV